MRIFHGMPAMTPANCRAIHQPSPAVPQIFSWPRGRYRQDVAGATFLRLMSGRLGPRQGLGAIAALQIDEPPTYEEVRQAAEAAFQKATSLLPQSEEAQEAALAKQAAADSANKEAEEAERKAAELGPHAESALREAREAAAELQGQHEEISSADLDTLAAHMLTVWEQSQTAAVTVQGLPGNVQIGMAGVDGGFLVARVAAAVVDGKRFAVAAIAIGERFPEGVLEGTVMHWGCSSRPGGGWDPPPPGWHTLPPVSFPAGKAWQTPFATHAPVIRGRTVASDPAYGLVLQIPMEGVLQRGGGLAFVLKRADGKNPQWVQSDGNRDFSISFEQVVKDFEDSTEAKEAQDQKPKRRVEGWVAQEGGEVASHACAPSAAGSLSQQYQAAVSFLQDIFSKSEDQGASASVAADYTAAKEALVGAKELIQNADAALEQAREAREKATRLQREAEEAGARVRGLDIDAKAAVRAARAAAAKLAGKEEEVGLIELHAIAEARLKGWMDWAASRRSWQTPDTVTAEESEGLVTFNSFRLHGLDGWLAARVTTCREGDTSYAVISLAAAESFPEGVLEGVVAHWGCAGVGRRGGWETPPAGWTTDASDSHEAGGGATECRMEWVEVPGYEGREDVAAYALTLQLPLEGSVGKGGVKLVLRTTDQQWLGCSYQGSRHDIFISLQQFGDALEGEEEADKPPDESASTAEPQADQTSASTPSPTAAYGQTASSVKDTAVAWHILDEIARLESKAERSLMHRFNIAHDLLDANGRKQDSLQEAVVAVAAWLRFSAARQLTWNRNYNIKPREISAAQDRLTNKLAAMYEQHTTIREPVLVAMAAVGRGGQGDVGQRIRDEILSVQSRNNAKGGMMEEWHQKLHNNTSPDDVVICEALIAYIEADLDIARYWATLQAAGITKERLASFDRAIRSEPNFKADQCAGLLKDLRAYLVTLKAVHLGADLQAAANVVLGYRQESMKGKSIKIHPVESVATPRLRKLLQEVLMATVDQASNSELVAGFKSVVQTVPDKLQPLLAVRQELQPSIQVGSAACDGRLRDVVFLDIALASSARSIVEGEIGALKGLAAGAQGTQELLRATRMTLESATLSFAGDIELALCLQDFKAAEESKAVLLRAIAAAERLSRRLGQISIELIRTWQPVADALGGKLGIEPAAVSLFSEEVLRGTAAAPLSQLLAILEPRLRQEAGLGSWQLISPAPTGLVTGRVVLEAALSGVQGVKYSEPTILITEMGGEEDIPEGVVAVVTGGDVPDVLSHAAVRARNCGVLLAACFDHEELSCLQSMAGSFATLTSTQDGASIVVSEGEQQAPEVQPGVGSSVASLPSIKKKAWCSKFAVTAAEFRPEVVGAKSLNTVKLMGRLPDWIKLPSSVAVPFGVAEVAIEASPSRDSIEEVVAALHEAESGETHAFAERLKHVQQLIREMDSPQGMQGELQDAFCTQGLPMLDDAAWSKAWPAIKAVWASKYNERAVLSMRKAGLRHEDLQMAALCQAVVPASHAFVAHSRHPVTGDEDVAYIELVQGLGETLVGNYPGSAFCFSAIKSKLPNGSRLPSSTDIPDGVIRIERYPSKSVALRVAAEGREVIFRSNSNGEDLEGYAGAGLFDSIQSSPPQITPADYAADRLFTDASYQQEVLGAISVAVAAVERCCGSAQDVEGVINDDGSIHIVQTRPQM